MHERRDGCSIPPAGLSVGQICQARRVPARLDEEVPEVGGRSLATQGFWADDMGNQEQLIFGNRPAWHEAATVAVLPADEAAGLSQCHTSELRTQPQGHGQDEGPVAGPVRPCRPAGSQVTVARQKPG